MLDVLHYWMGCNVGYVALLDVLQCWMGCNVGHVAMLDVSCLCRATTLEQRLLWPNPVLGDLQGPRTVLDNHMYDTGTRFISASNMTYLELLSYFLTNCSLHSAPFTSRINASLWRNRVRMLDLSNISRIISLIKKVVLRVSAEVSLSANFRGKQPGWTENISREVPPFLY